MSSKNIYPILNETLSKEDKELQLNQKALVIWMIGLSGSGKSTLAKGLEKKLYQNGFFTQLLDGDNLRSGLNSNLEFSKDDRKENIRRAAEVANIFYNSGIITICSFITPTEEIKKIVKQILGNAYIEVYVNTSLDECKKRDVKGLYKKAEDGLINDFTGVSSPFEVPQNPDIEVNTESMSIEESIDKIYNTILPDIKNQ